MGTRDEEDYLKHGYRYKLSRTRLLYGMQGQKQIFLSLDRVRKI